MTVGELIEELKKFPEHHVALVLYGDPNDWVDGQFVNNTDEASITELRSHDRGVVIIDATHE